LHESYENLVGELDETDEMLAPMPEPSRWEKDDNMEAVGGSRRRVSPHTHHQSPSVTSDVLKRAENAIFKKAITALRPESKRSGWLINIVTNYYKQNS